MSSATNLKVAASSLLLLLSSCGWTLPPYAGLSVHNFYENFYEDQQELGLACKGGIEIHLDAGSLNFETLVADYDESQRIDFPEDVRAGTPAILEVWCYDDTQQNAGHIKISKPLQGASAADLVISMRSEDLGREGCAKGIEEVAPVPCVVTGIL